jgi:hypothetical protein
MPDRHDAPATSAIEELHRRRAERELTLADNEALEKETPKAAVGFLLESLLEDGLVRGFLHVNHYQGVDYFNKEAYESLCLSFFVIPQLEHPSRDSLSFEEELLAELKAAQEASEF